VSLFFFLVGAIFRASAHEKKANRIRGRREDSSPLYASAARERLFENTVRAII